MKTLINTNFSIKSILLLTIISLAFSYPSISTYSSYERYITETINKFSSAVKNLNFTEMNLSKYNIPINKTEGTTKRTGALTNFKPSKPLFNTDRFYGKITNNTTVFLNNEDKEDTFQIDLNLTFEIFENDSTTPKNGTGILKFDVENFNFTLSYDQDFIEFIVNPDLEINFKFLNFSILNCTEELKDIETLITNEVRNSETIPSLEVLISEYIDRNIEKFFKQSERFSSISVTLSNKAEQLALGVTPLLLPVAEKLNNTNKGIKNYLDGKPYNLDGSKIERIDYKQNEDLINLKNVFDLSINSPRQVFISNEAFADMMKVDFKKDSEIIVYENDVKAEIPFRFNVMYLNKFMPGLNYHYTNTQKFYIEIKVRDIKYNYGENDLNSEPTNKSFVIVSTDVFFKTAEKNSGQTILSFSADTKVYLEILNEKDSAYFNVKFAENIEIQKLSPFNYASLEFYNDLFKEEFAKSFTITNLGVFDYKLFKYPILMSDLISENHALKPMLKGVLIYEKPQNLNDFKEVNKIEQRKSLKFLK